MKRSLAAAGVVGAMLLLAAGGPARAAGVSKEKFDQIVAKLQTGARPWVELGKPLEEEVEEELKRVVFDAESVAHLNALLRVPKRDAIHLYVVHRLLERLVAAKPEAIRPTLPNVKAVQSRVRSMYLSPPQLTKAQIAALTMPAYSSRMSSQDIMSRLAVLDGLRQQKVAREEFIVRHNAMIGGIEAQAYRAMFLADDAREDAALVRAMFLEERAGRSLFLTLAADLGRDAAKMKPERAQKLCALLGPAMAPLEMQRRKPYYNRGSIILKGNANSEFEKKDDYAGIRVRTTFNQLVKAAKSTKYKPVTVPNNKQIDEYWKKRTPPPRK